MFDPQNPFGLQQGDDLLSRLLSPQLNGHTFHQEPGLVREALELLDNFPLGSNQFGGDGQLWQTTSGPQGAGGGYLALYWLLNSQALNRLLRYAARYLYETNGLCKSAVELQEALALGEGFGFTGKTKAADKRLQAWLRKTKFLEKSPEWFQREVIDGEVIIRLFGEPPDVQLRIVDPDFLYGISDQDDYLGARFQGIWYDNQDHETEVAYEIHPVPFGGPGRRFDRRLQRLADGVPLKTART